MKQIIITGIILITMIMFSCKNQDWSFPDFDYTTTYFPYQFPIRTLVLGDYYFDNTNDNQLKFLIGARMGGVYNNTKTITVSIALDEKLTDSLYNSVTGLPMKALPASYYTLSNSSQIIIPSGMDYGTITVQLTPAFLDDPLAISTRYVVPLKIISSTTDSVLEGSTIQPGADPRIAASWIKPPKNFTLFGIKFVNQYHGKYLLRGTDVVKRTSVDTIVETIIYRNKYIERCELADILTASKDAVTYSNSIRKTPTSPGKFEMLIPFDSNGNAVLSQTAKYSFPVTGNAKFVKDDAEWGGHKRHVIYLDYKVVDPTYTHYVKDTLVFRNKMVVFEEYKPLIKVP